MRANEREGKREEYEHLEVRTWIFVIERGHVSCVCMIIHGIPYQLESKLELSYVAGILPCCVSKNFSFILSIQSPPIPSIQSRR